MCSNPVVAAIFDDFQKSINVEQELREKIREICKETDQLSREITTLLQIIHHDVSKESAVCGKARELFAKAKEGYQKLKEVVPASDYYKYADHWRYMTQRYCFLISLTIWLEVGTLANIETIAETLGITAEEKKIGFHLDIEDYLHGILQLCTELSRLAVNAVILNDYQRPMQISAFVMEVNAGFRLLNLKNDHLRKRYDVLKYDVKKIEEVVYDLSIRGLLPKSEPDAQEKKPE